MKILKVRFLNINALKGEWEISFDEAPLSESGLFVITGATGAGKTTILDAITLALYGESPRYKNDSGEIREAMTHNTAECFAEVDFSASQKSYRTKWSVRRSRNKIDGKLQAPKREIVDLATGAIIFTKTREVNELITEVTGLDKHRFLRSVMLAQGDFATFLRAKENERGELLEKITGLEIYSQIGKSAHERKNVESEKLRDLESQIDQNQLLTAEVKTTLKNEQADAHGAVESLNTQISAHQAEIRHIQEMATLSQQIEKNRQNYTQVCNEISAFQPEAARLKQHFHLLPLQPDYALLKNITAQLTVAQKSHQENEAKIPQLNAQIKVAEAEKNQQVDQLKKAKLILEELAPRVQKALEKDAEIKPLIVQLTAVRQKTAQLSANLKEAETDKETLFKQTETVKHQHTELTKWAKENQIDARVGEIISVVEVHADELKNSHQQKNDAIDLQNALKNKSAENSRLKKDADEKVAKKQGEIGAVTQKIQQLDFAKAEVLNGLSEADFEAQFVQIEVDEVAHQKRLSYLADFQQNQDQLKMISVEMAQSVAQLATHQKTKSAKTVEKQELAQVLEDLQRLISQAKLITKYETARKQLEENSPCPLCGATEHPFVATGGYANDLSADEHRFTTQTTAHQEVLAQLVGLEKEIGGLETAQKAYQNQHKKRVDEAKSIQEAFLDIGKPSDSLGLNAPEKIRQVAIRHHKLFVDAVEQRQNLNAILSDFSDAQKGLIEAQQNLAQAEKEGQQFSTRHAELEGQLKNTQKLQTESQAKIEKVQQELQKILLPIEITFSAETEVLAVVQLLKNRHHTYQEKTDLLKATVEKKGQLKFAFQDAENRVKNLQAQFDEAGESEVKIGTTLAELKLERNTLLADENPEKVLETQKASISKIEDALKQSEMKLASQQNDLTKETATLNTQLTEIERLEKTIGSQEKTFLADLKNKGVKGISEFEKAILSETEQAQLQEKQTQLHARETEVKTVLAQAEKQYQAFLANQKNEKPLPILQTELGQLEVEKNASLEKIGEIKTRLEIDADLRQTHQKVAKKIEAQQRELDKWQNLAELIGSAQGDKFSKFAQGLTLAQLISYANLHLARLNERYKIARKTGTDLGMQIIDCYQADAIRPTQSLSGGESFLVSLALALALSDLSSQKSPIESLFIDEGFGTLDADTLDTAISTLENLQASGKTIGVISHVDALKERISTQIQVHKLSGGYSRLEVVS